MTDPRPQDGAPADTAPPRRGRWLRRGCGCGAFLFGAIVTLVAFAPLLFGRFALEAAIADANDAIAGEIELGEVAFSWTGTQRLDRLRLRDPEGRTVAELDVEVPSIFTVLGALASAEEGEPADLGTWKATAELALVTSPDQPSNIERALAPPRRSAKVDGAGAGDGGDSGAGAPATGGADREVDVSYQTPLGPIRALVELEVKHFSWTDPRLDDGGRAVGVKDLVARLVLTADGDARFTLDGEHLYGTDHGPVAADFTFDQSVLFGASAFLASAEGSARIESVPTILVDLWTRSDGELRDALGDRLSLEADFAPESAGSDDAVRVDVALLAEGQDVRFRGRVADRVLTARGDEPQVWSLSVPRAIVDRHLADALPEGLALELDGGVLPVEVELARLALPLDGEADASRADLRVSLASPGFRVRQDGAASIDVSSVNLVADAERGGPLALEASVREAGGGAVDVRLHAPVGWATATAEEMRDGLLAWDLQADVRGVTLSRLAAWAPDAGLDALGEYGSMDDALTATLRARPAGDDVVDLELDATLGASDVRAALRVDEAGFTKIDGAETRAHLVLPPATLAKLLGPEPPMGLAPAPGSAPIRAELTVDELNRPNEGAPTASFIARVHDVSLTAPALEAANERLAVEHLEARVALAPDAPVTARLDLALAGGGALTATAESDLALSAWQKTAEGGTAAPITWTLRAEGRDLRTSIVDALAEQDGLLVDVLGATLALDAVATEATAQGAQVDATLTSPKANVALVGAVRDGVLTASGEGGSLDARVGLTPLFRERVVGKLVPMLVSVEAAEDSEPTTIHVTDFAFPLGATGSALDAVNADVTLDLGRVQAAVLPDLARWFTSHVHRPHPTDLPTLQLEIRGGVVNAPAIPIEIEGTPVTFSGSYALAAGTMDFDASVPLSGLRGDVGRAIDDARKYLDPNTAVPLQLSGKPTRPKIGVSSDFLRDVIRDAGRKAAEDALGEGLRKLFGDD